MPARPRPPSTRSRFLRLAPTHPCATSLAPVPRSPPRTRSVSASLSRAPSARIPLFSAPRYPSPVATHHPESPRISHPTRPARPDRDITHSSVTALPRSRASTRSPTAHYPPPPHTHARGDHRARSSHRIRLGRTNPVVFPSTSDPSARTTATVVPRSGADVFFIACSRARPLRAARRSMSTRRRVVLRRARHRGHRPSTGRSIGRSPRARPPRPRSRGRSCDACIFPRTGAGGCTLR